VVIMMMVVVVVRLASRTHSSMYLLACPPSDEIYSMFNKSIREESLQVFFNCLDTTREGDNERFPYRACDRS
jgi:hypothetical protein